MKKLIGKKPKDKDVIEFIDEFNQGVNMIETDEREELCPFFDKTIKATGIELPENSTLH